jgi:hypothetical protein
MAREAPTRTWATAGGQVVLGPDRQAIAGDLHQTELRIHAAYRSKREVGGGDLYRYMSATGPGHHPSSGAVGQRRRPDAADHDGASDDPAGGEPFTERGQHRADRRAPLQPQAGAEHGVECRGVGVGPAELFEQGRHRHGGIHRQRLVPSDLVKGAIEGGAAGGFAGVPKGPLEQPPVVRVHHRSDPRSRRRRAMMFRWISAVPP